MSILDSWFDSAASLTTSESAGECTTHGAGGSSVELGATAMSDAFPGCAAVPLSNSYASADTCDWTNAFGTACDMQVPAESTSPFTSDTPYSSSTDW